jgi:hypothetical protein
MAYDIKNLNVASLDFDNIKSSLITFLEQQNDLKDLDFRNNASAVNLLLNILATVTAYNGVYAQYGYVNSFATTTTLLESILGIASNSSVLIAPTLSASTTRTINAVGATLEEYSTFSAKSPSGSDPFFFNIESINKDSTKAITLYSGSEVVNYTGYNYETQSVELPYTVNPETISFYESSITKGETVKWTRVEKSSTAITGDNRHFTVINGPRGYIVTNNFASARTITTTSKVLLTAIISNGGIGNNAVIFPKANTTFATTPLPTGGYSLITVAQAKAMAMFKATGQARCVTLADYKKAILGSGINGTENESDISVVNGDYPGQVKIYVNNLSKTSQDELMDYLSSKTMAGIGVVYEQ